MSWVNNVLVVFGYDDNPAERLAEVNKYLYENSYKQQQFVDATEEDNWYGGSKFMVGDIWAAAFNYVLLETVLEALNKATWLYPKEVKLIWMGEGDPGWTVYTL